LLREQKNIIKLVLGIFLFLICNNTWASDTLTLKDAISLGLENNKRIASAKEQFKGANAGVKGAISSLYPHLNLTGNSSYREALGKNEAEEQDNYSTSLGLTISQTIFDDKNRLSIKGAKKDLEYELYRIKFLITQEYYK
jgi:outer membrane protein TolC